MFNTNVGIVDRTIRIIVGLVLLSLFFFYPVAPWRYLTLIGIVPLITGLFGACPLYSIIGVNTCSAKKS